MEWPEKPTGAGEASVEALPPLGDQSSFSSSTGKAVGVAGSELEADGGPPSEREQKAPAETGKSAACETLSLQPLQSHDTYCSQINSIIFITSQAVAKDCSQT